MSLALGTTIAWIPAGEDHVTKTLRMLTRDLDQSRCALTQQVVPDKPWVDRFTRRLPLVASQPVDLIDGAHVFVLRCPSPLGTRSARASIHVSDGQPEACLDVAFDGGPITATSFDELEAGMVGAWEGCVHTPWTPTYAVEITFRADGTYSVSSSEVLDGATYPAFYYGSDEDSPAKQWMLDDFLGSRKGVGEIDLTWGAGNGVTRGELRNIALMDDELRFEYFHFGTYGPVTFELRRVTSS